MVCQFRHWGGLLSCLAGAHLLLLALVALGGDLLGEALHALPGLALQLSTQGGLVTLRVSPQLPRHRHQLRVLLNQILRAVMVVDQFKASGGSEESAHADPAIRLGTAFVTTCATFLVEEQQLQ